MDNIEFKNWKLKEVANYIEVVAYDSIEHKKQLLTDLKLPLTENIGANRSETDIDWAKMPQYYKFFFDREGWEERIRLWLEKSKLAIADSVIVSYGWKEPMVKVPIDLFIEDWEGFIRSTLWETVIFSENWSLIMEVSRDYYLHSNFEIMPDTRVV